MPNAKIKRVKFWAIKIFFITLLVAAAISLAAEYFMSRISTALAVLILMLIVFIGVFFDIIGVAVSTCDETPFLAMASKKVKGARHALRLLKNAPSVANFCNDVVGDVCGIVSGAAGAAIAVRLAVNTVDTIHMYIVIGISALIAALTVSLKAAGKSLAMNKNKQIVLLLSSFINVFRREDV